MDLLSLPSTSGMPALSKSSTASDSSMEPTPLSSGLCTPSDVEIESFDDVFIAIHPPLGKNEFFPQGPPFTKLEPFNLADPPALKSKPLSRVVAKAKKMAGKTLSVRKTLRKARSRSFETSPASLDQDLSDISNIKDVMLSSGLSIKITRDVVSDAGAVEEHESNLSDTQLVRAHDSIANSPESKGKGINGHFNTSETLLDSLDSFLTLDDSSSSREPLTLPTSKSALLRIIFFLPWCITVGGAILLSPQHLEIITFPPGYLSSPTGTRRFAFWADCAAHQVFIFLACLAAYVWWDFPRGVLLASAALARFVYVWHDFRVDQSIPPGEDDRQSLYLVVTLAYTKEDMVIRTIPNRLTSSLPDAQGEREYSI
ncbi:hypothetical protein AcV7_010020 [Taiwanofungus camphoratus]|nr:hypothetical protein AcV7_010020 [Antrodia cinnamomea]